MKKILLVDDDALVLRMYQDGLAQHGFEVEIASDGLAALKALRANKPDLVVLDLMMPKFTGVDVLRFIRSQAGLANLPVVVLSNSYMNEIAQQAVGIGVQMALLKIRSSPPLLVDIINNILAGKPALEDPSQLLAVPKPGPAASKPVSAAPTAPAPAMASPAGSDPQALAQYKEKADDAAFHAKARADFLANTATTRVTIRNHCKAYTHAKNDAERSIRLQDFYRKVHFLSAAAGLAHCHHIAFQASAFEALLFEVMMKPAFITPSVQRTIAFTVDFLGTLFDHAREAVPDTPLSANALVVDDDPLSNRLVVAALQRAQLQARSAEDPLVALQWLYEGRYDLVLLDIEMPGMDGFEVCKRLRATPGYRRIPVIYVTGHGDFESRAKSVLSGGNDLIAKPVFAIELAVKAVTHLLKYRLDEQAQHH